MTRKRNPEQAIQCAVVEHLRVRGVAGLVFFHCPNGGYRTPAEASILKAMGVRAGVSDLVLFHAGKLHCLEIKAQGGRASAEQCTFLASMKAEGAYTALATGLEACLTTLEEWKLIKPSMTMRGILERLDAA